MILIPDVVEAFKHYKHAGPPSSALLLQSKPHILVIIASMFILSSLQQLLPKLGAFSEHIDNFVNFSDRDPDIKGNFGCSI